MNADALDALMRSPLPWVVLAALLLGVVFILRRRRRAPPAADDSAYGRWQRDQEVLWKGRPVTVVFDYTAYLQEPERRKVNVHSVQVSAMGERSVLGFCHDQHEDRTFKLSGMTNGVLVERSREQLSTAEWVERLMAGDSFAPVADPAAPNEMGETQR